MTAEPIRSLVAARALQAVAARRRPQTPAELAQRLIPGYRVTPTIRLISDVLADAIPYPDRRCDHRAPRSSAKSLLTSVVAPVFALSCDPDARSSSAATPTRLPRSIPERPGG